MLHWINRLLIIGSLLLLASCGEQDRENAETSHYEFGIFQTNRVSDAARAELGSSTRSTIRDSLNVTATRTVPAELNTIFGVAYRFPKNTLGSTVKVRGTVTFPAPGITNPTTGETAPNARVEANIVVDTQDPVDSLLFKMGQDWEVVTGTWKFDILLDGEEFIHEEFEVITKE